MASIRSPGIGSNLDIDTIVTQLMNLERTPLIALDKKEAAYQVKVTAYGALRGSLASLQSTLRALSSPSSFQAVRAVSQDSSVFTASASSNVSLGTHNIEVSKLAQAHSLRSSGSANTTDVIGTGTLTIRYGTYDSGGNTFTANPSASAQTVTIDAAHQTLSGVRDAINAANIGVTASIVNDGSTNGNKLVATSKNSGAANSIKITVADGDATHTDTSGLSQLAYDPTLAAGSGKNLTQTVVAQNAEATINGIAISKASNTITDALEGVTINLLNTNIGAAKKLTISKDSTQAKASIENFVKAYNDLQEMVKDLTVNNEGTDNDGPLIGDAALRSVQNQIRSQLSATIPGTSGAYRSLSDIGISFQRDGSLKVDTSKLDAAIAANPTNVSALFAESGVASDPLVSFVSATSSTSAGSYGLSISQLATRGKTTGSVVAGLTITTGVDDQLDVTVNGVTAGVTLTSGTYTAATLAEELQSKLNGASAFTQNKITVSVSQSGGVLTVTSDTYGSSSTVRIAGGTAQSGLFGTSTDVDGVNVGGTIGGQSATGTGQELVGNGANTSDLKLRVTGGDIGLRGSITYSKGFAKQLDDFITDLDQAGGILSARTNGIDNSIKDIERQRETLGRRLEMVERRYRAQFAALDALVGSMLNTGNFLQQQLSNLPKSGSS